MRVVRVAAVLLLALVGPACLVVSLHPVYEPETIAFEPALLGEWVADEDPVVLTFERAEWHSYHVVYADADKTPVRLSVRLTRVADMLLLDLTPLDGADIGLLQLPVHAVYRATIEDGTLSLAPLNYDWLFDRVREGTAGLPAAIDARTNVIVTAPTAELRKWIAAHAADDGLFAAPVMLHRKTAAASIP